MGQVLKLLPIQPGEEAPPPLVFGEGRYRIGRGRDCDFVLTATGIKGRHCLVVVAPTGASLIRLDPDAAISLDGTPLPGEARIRLKPGMVLGLGSRRFQVLVEEDAAAPPAGGTTTAAALASAFPRTIDALSLQAEPSATGMRPGSVFAGCRIEAQIGSGGSAEVYRAVRLADQQVVALKILKPGVEFEQEAGARLYREARIGGRLATHRSVIAIHAVGKAQQRSYIEMEFVEGTEAQALLDSGGPLPPSRALDIVLQVADGLRFARQFQIIHRDIKPGNILVRPDGSVKLLDLGLARVAGAVGESFLTQANEGLGSLNYVAPEQASDAATVDHRADIYALGATLFALLTGFPPFVQRSLLQLMRKIVTEKAPTLASLNPAFPEVLSRAVERCLEKEPAARYQDYDELIRDLEAARKAYPG